MLKKKKSFTSTWLSVSAKNMNFASYLPASELVLTEAWSPVCEVTPPSLRSLDHLSGLKMKDQLQYQAEIGLKEAFQTLAGKKEEGNKESIEKVGARIAYGLSKVGWSLTNNTKTVLLLESELLDPQHCCCSLLEGPGKCSGGAQLHSSFSLLRA